MKRSRTDHGDPVQALAERLWPDLHLVDGRVDRLRHLVCQLGAGLLVHTLPENATAAEVAAEVERLAIAKRTIGAAHREATQRLESLRALDTIAQRRENVIARAQAAATKWARPVWLTAPAGDGVWVVDGIEDGMFVIRDLLQPLVPSERRMYLLRTGTPRPVWSSTTAGATDGRLDAPATLIAWRLWCAERSQGRAP